ncbi:hypothetical protein Pcinc_020980 [Petrolisthes cinctipes]|nr:hypothetical protein Pcinc_020980 [Petrolisthes cinctipes]
MSTTSYHQGRLYTNQTPDVDLCLPCDDLTNTDGDDLSPQLHSNVRTSNLETSLRLLSLGADPNFYHKEKECCPLHIAARAGQASQVELLIVYGAHPGTTHSQSNTPTHYTSESNHRELAEHLTDCQYEVTDHLAFYLSGCKPEPQHRTTLDYTTDGSLT